MVISKTYSSGTAFIFFLFFLCLGVRVVSQTGAITLAAPPQTITSSFYYTGAVQSFTVPSCVLTLTIDAEGAQGGSNASSGAQGGLGGRARGVLNVTPGDIIYIFVGGSNGYNGGGNPGNTPCAAAMGGTGGGASDVRLNATSFINRVIVAGGGGGAGGDRVLNCGRGSGGGGGGGYYGGGGGCGFPQNSTLLPGGGTQSAGGSGGISGFTASQNGFPGSVGSGGNGGSEVSSLQLSNKTASPGGNGGGLIGSNGQQPATTAFTGQSGAGGSSFLGNLANAATIPGTRAGDGQVTIAYRSSIPVAVSASGTLICANSNVTLSAVSLTSYTWSNGSYGQSTMITPAVTTTYSLSGINTMGCAVDAAVSILVNPGPPVLAIANSSPVICPNQPVTLTGSGAISYSWSGNVLNGVAFSPAATSNYTVTGANACGNASAVTSVSISQIPVNIVTTPSHVCAGNTVTLSASGASLYSWQTVQAGTLSSVSGSSTTGAVIVVTPTAGIIYTVTGLTNACSGAITYTLHVDPTPDVFIAPGNSVICLGQSAALNATGAVTYAWNNGLSGSSISVSPGVSTLYWVTATNAYNCSNVAFQPVLVNPNPTLTIIASDLTVCSGGLSILSVSGANAYLWTTPGNNTTSTISVSPLITTSYSVTGTATTGCTSGTVLTVSVFSPTIGISSNTAICKGGSTLLGAFGADSYTWSAFDISQYITVGPSASRMYTVHATVTSNDGVSCETSNTVSVMVNQLPVVTISGSDTIICRGQVARLNGNGAVSYSWSCLSAGSNTSAVNVSPVSNHTYSVAGLDANGCYGAGAYRLAVSSCNGIREQEENKSLTIYPNPGNGIFRIVTQEQLDLQITDGTGRLVKFATVSAGNPEINMEALNDGVYFVSARSGNGSVRAKLIIAR